MYSYRFLIGVVISILSFLAISVADAARAGWQPAAALADDAPRLTARIAVLDGLGGALDRPDGQLQGGGQQGFNLQGGFQQFGGQQLGGGLQQGFNLQGGFQQFGGQQGFNLQGGFQQFGGQQGFNLQGGFQQFGGQQLQGGGINLQGGFQGGFRQGGFQQFGGGGFQGVPGTRGPRGWEVLGPPPVIVLPPPPSPILIPILPPPAVEPATVVPSAPADGTTPQ